jgi:hypothetical protein
MTLRLLSALKRLPSTTYLYGALAVALWGAVAAYSAHQREIGRLSVLTAQATAQRDSLAAVLKVKERQFRVDTVRVFRSITTLDTLIQSRVDTAVVHQTDTVKITIHEATAIQDTLKACRSLVRDCAAIQADLRGFIRADSAIIRNLRRQLPSKLTPWRDRAIGAIVGGAIMAVARP